MIAFDSSDSRRMCSSAECRSIWGGFLLEFFYSLRLYNSKIQPRMLVPLLLADIPLVHIHQEQQGTPNGRAHETKHISGLRGNRLTEESSQGNSDQNRYSLSALHKAPGSREIPSPDPFVGVHLQRVVISSAKDS